MKVGEAIDVLLLLKKGNIATASVATTVVEAFIDDKVGGEP